MEAQLFSLKYGIGGICVLLTLMVLSRVAEFVWRIKEKRDSLSESAIVSLTKALQENTAQLHILDLRLKALEAAISDFPKLKNDLRRFYSAIKEVAGDRWPMIRDEIMKDGFTV